MWLTPKKMKRKPGTPGRIVLLLDVSGSMMEHLTEVAREARRALTPGMKIVIFASTAKEFDPRRLHELEDKKLRWDHYDDVGGGTHMSCGLAAVLKMNPQTTLAMGDGQSAVDRLRCLQIADQMTGSIHCYVCGDDEYGLMRDLARIGGGNLTSERDGFRKALKDAIQDLTPQTEPDMARQRLPDMMLDESDEFEFQRPDDVEIDLRQKITLLRGTILEEKFVAPERHRIGGPVQQSIGVRSAEVTIHEPVTTVKKGLLGWLTSPVQQPQEAYKGTLQPVAQQPALPAPQAAPRGVPALPRPNAATFSPQIPDGREVPMVPVQSRVPATYKR